MKNTSFAILLFFATMLVANGLIAQNPVPVHAQGTDKEVRATEAEKKDQAYDRSQARDRKAKGKDQAAAAQETGKGTGHNAPEHKDDENEQDHQAKGQCEGDHAGKDKVKGKSDKAGEKHEAKLDKEGMKDAMKQNKGQIKDRKANSKDHPIFERREDARNGKGANGQ